MQVGRTGQRRRSPPSSEGLGCKFGGRATKVGKLNLGGLAGVAEPPGAASRLTASQEAVIASQKSAEGVVAEAGETLRGSSLRKGEAPVKSHLSLREGLNGPRR